MIKNVYGFSVVTATSKTSNNKFYPKIISTETSV